MELAAGQLVSVNISNSTSRIVPMIDKAPNCLDLFGRPDVSNMKIYRWRESAEEIVMCSTRTI